MASSNSKERHFPSIWTVQSLHIILFFALNGALAKSNAWRNTFIARNVRSVEHPLNKYQQFRIYFINSLKLINLNTPEWVFFNILIIIFQHLQWTKPIKEIYSLILVTVNYKILFRHNNNIIISYIMYKLWWLGSLNISDSAEHV